MASSPSPSPSSPPSSSPSTSPSAAAPPPPLHIPPGAAVSVSIIDTTTICKLPLGLQMGPHIRGHDWLDVPAYAFLVQHPSGRRVVYDLGTRTSIASLPPGTRAMLDQPGWAFGAAKHVAEILDEGGVPRESIEAVVWSHWHFDHTGDMTTFPPSVRLVVGEGFTKNLLPGYPTNPASHVLEADLAGRDLVEVSYGNALTVGGCRAFDYFGDGSFYLLDAPGHAVGHMCGLARVTTGPDPDTFVFMGGDTCHHGGVWKPNQYFPLPAEVHLRRPVAGRTVCPGSLFQAVHRHRSDRTEFYDFAEGYQHDDALAQATKRHLQAFDADPRVLVVVAHDTAPLDPASGFVFFPSGTLDDWKARRLDERIRWNFLEDFAEAVETGTPQDTVLPKGVAYR